MRLSLKTIITVLKLSTNQNGALSTKQLDLPKYCTVAQNLKALYNAGYVHQNREGRTLVYSLTSLGKELKEAIVKYFYDKEFRDLFNLMDGVKEHTVLTLVSLGFDTLDQLEKYTLQAGLRATRPQLTCICNALHEKQLIEAYTLAGDRPIFLTDIGKKELSSVEDFIYSHNPSRLTTKSLSKNLPTKLLCGRK